MKHVLCLLLSACLVAVGRAPFANDPHQCKNNLLLDSTFCTRDTIDGTGGPYADHEKVTRRLANVLLSRGLISVQGLNNYGLKPALQNLNANPNPVRTANCPLRANNAPIVSAPVPCCEHPLINSTATCEAAPRYRTYDGTCNNLNNPLWGAAGSNYVRITPPGFHDGISEPRRSVDGTPLPNARRVSLKFFVNATIESDCNAAIHFVWGQFLDHDITFAQEDPDKPTCDCCPTAHDGRCYVITRPPWDPTHDPSKCIVILRKKAGQNTDCDYGPREQINPRTSYIDASQVYGSSQAQADSLRDPTNRALMKISTNGTGNKYLPPDPNVNNVCADLNPAIHTTTCPLAGDDRVVEQPALTGFHLFFVLLHNYIASNLITLRGASTDKDKVYLDTRRIIGAVLQRVTYAEYLPTVIGDCMMNAYGLNTLSGSSTTNDYSGSINAAAISEFAVSAFRYGHATVVQNLEFWNVNVPTPTLHDTLPLAFAYNHANQDILRAKMLMKGICQQRTMDTDRGFSDSVRNQLFLDRVTRKAQDLPAIDIQRERELGLPGYVKAVQACGMGTVNSFKDLVTLNLMDQEVVDDLQKSYCNIFDVDLFAGGMAEKPVVGALVGPTFSCIIANQFRNLRYGDRFWHESGMANVVGFTGPQLNELRSWTLARLLVTVFPDLQPIQAHVFEIPSATNPLVSGAVNFPPLVLSSFA